MNSMDPETRETVEKMEHLLVPGSSKADDGFP